MTGATYYFFLIIKAKYLSESSSPSQ